MSTSGRQRVARVGLAVCCILLALVGWTSWRSVSLMRLSSERVQDNYALLNELERVFSLVKDAESAQRGFIITGKREYLTPYEDASTNAPLIMNGLHGRLLQEGIPEVQIALLEERTSEKLDYVAKLISLKNAGRGDEALKMINERGTGLALMEDIRDQVKSISDQLRNQLLLRRETAENNASRAITMSFGSLSVHLLLLGAVALLVRGELRARTEAEEAMGKARDAAVQSARMKSEFLANMSHEIRTPMNGVLGMLNLLLETKLDKEQRLKAETARSSAESLLTILNDILDFSKIEAGKLSFEMTNFKLREIVESAVEMLAPKAQEKRLELASMVYSDVPDNLVGDPSRLRQVLVNLIGNAIKFTKTGEVVVRVKRGEDANQSSLLHFSVTDTGVGINDTAMERLFQPFAQADASTTREFGGTGLGLAISRQLAEGMGGQIGAHSTPGKGSEFWFTARFDKAADVAAVPRPEFLKGSKVLVVDDNETNRQILKAQLDGWGINSQEAASAADALKLLRPGHDLPEVILMDMQMPHMSGVELARTIRSEFGAGIKMILLTSGGMTDQAEMQSAGFSFWLTKPVKQSALMDCMASALAPERIVPREAPPEKRVRAKQPFGLIRILLAEDNRVNQMVAQGLLERLGYRADIAANGLEVLAALDRTSYDVIFMDCQMPEMDGYEATARVRGSEKAKPSPGVHIIAMTAHAMQGDREKCLAAGMNDYLSKPVGAQEIHAALERFAKSRVKPSKSVLKEQSMQDLEALNAPDRPDAMQEVVRYFMEDAPLMVEKIIQSVSAKDAKSTGRSAHKLSGSASIFGATDLILECRRLEEEVRDGAWENATATAGRLQQACLDVMSELKRRVG